MTRLTFQDLAQFTRRYRFAGARLRRVRLLHRGKESAVEVVLSVSPAAKDAGEPPKPVRLKLRLDGAEEFRFQKRPNAPAGRPIDVKFGYFNGLFYLNLDTWGLPPGEVPAVYDFRASEAFAAGRELSWEEVTKPAG
ncbi:MAG: hypothetical protein ABGY75_02095 [Gemmataceae bacterium]